MPPSVTVATISEDPQSYEDEYVHAVYDEIAPHFSSTRYKPWPIIARFISSLPAGWVGLDSGTGNGKYLPLPLDRSGKIWTIGLDRSRKLLQIAQKAGEGDVVREVVWGDVLSRPWRDGAFDYAISIATIHHLATPARRMTAVQRIMQSISPSHGRALIYVWAIEQDGLSKRTIPTETKDSHLKVSGQDVFVPWVLASGAPTVKSAKRGKDDIDSKSSLLEQPKGEVNAKVFNRYYHMFDKGELIALVHDAARDLGLKVGPKLELPEIDQTGRKGIHIVDGGWERSNYYVEFSRWECP